jgi:SecD/SecF fusion protein
LTGQQNRTFLFVVLVLAVIAGWVTLTPTIKPTYGLDIRGGVRVALRAKTEEYKDGKWNDASLEAVRRVIENRVNFTGVSEPTIITKPQDQVVVELPGLKDEAEAIKSLQSTASLEFYWLRQLGNKDHSREGVWSISETVDPVTKAKQEVLVDRSGTPITPEQLQDGVFSSDPIVTGKDLQENSCRAVITGTGDPEIEFQFKDKGASAFEDFTRAHVGEYLAVFLDHKLLTAPTIEGVIPGGKGVIHGNFTVESSKALAANLNAGALPVPLEIVETRKLEATLGAEAVRETTIAGVAGLVLVLIFMVAWYRLPGIIANAALLLYALFSIALFKVIPVTLTLPGIAGFILSIGMAVDANILIFERLKEELRSGKTLRAAIDAGFKRAFTAIFDSNFCTAMTCCVLFYFGTGPIRGFALTLGLGVGVSMFTAITVTRTFLFALVSMGVAAREEAYGLNERHFNLKVMSRKAMWLGFSLAVIVPGIIAWIGGGIKYSIDFTGGTELSIPYKERHSVADIESALAGAGPKYKNSRVVVSGGAESRLAYVTTSRLTIPEREELQKLLVDKVGPLTPGQQIAYSDVSGTISRELTRDAVLAVLLASGLIVLYLTFRFAIGGWKEGLKYGLCAVIALLHDVLVVWGVFALLGAFLKWQIDSLFVTAMLTVIGFSVHDTIIVFDRVRENLNHRAKGENFSDLTDKSIDQTFSRSIKTSFTVVLVLLAMFIKGGAVINHFVFALLIGILSGTYSSIFNASVLLVMWKKMDTGLTLAGAGANTGAKSALVARPASALPGDKPLVTPAKSATSVVESAASAESQETASSESNAATRKAPVRKRRM